MCSLLKKGKYILNLKHCLFVHPEHKRYSYLDLTQYPRCNRFYVKLQETYKYWKDLANGCLHSPVGVLSRCHSVHIKKYCFFAMVSKHLSQKTCVQENFFSSAAQSCTTLCIFYA